MVSCNLELRAAALVSYEKKKKGQGSQRAAPSSYWRRELRAGDEAGKRARGPRKSRVQLLLLLLLLLVPFGFP